MTQLLHRAQRLSASVVRTGRTPALALMLAAGLSGCHHKTRAFVLPATIHAPVALEMPAPTNTPAEIATVPLPDLPDLPPLPPPAPRRRPAPTPAPAPKENASPAPTEPESAALAIGALTTGGDDTSQNQQQSQDLIASVQKRIAALPARIAEAQKQQIKQIVHFIEQAQQALNSGDTEGAKTLATKAKLLLDDLEKK